MVKFHEASHPGVRRRCGRRHEAGLDHL